jgi:DNA-binding beta-propeller fold protein YncE
MRFFVLYLLVGLTLVCSACSGGTAHVSQMPTPSHTSSPSPQPTMTLGPAVYAPALFSHGMGCPDDLTLDGQERVIFTDWKTGGVNRIESNGQTTVLAQGLPQVEGVIALSDGTLLLTEQGLAGQHIDQIVQLQVGKSTTPTILATFVNNTTQDGMDSITLDPHTGDILAADSPNGNIYRVSRDGKTVTKIASGFVRPTEALEDPNGRIFVADEYGNNVKRIEPNGQITMLAHVPAPDDLAFDLDGTLLVTALGDNTLVRLDPNTGQQLGVLAKNLFEPQGLAIDGRGNIYVSEERANVIIILHRGGTPTPFTPPQATGIACG